MASLQINRTHYCSAGMFKLGFLVTTGTCISGIENERSNADVVMGNEDLNKGGRYEILNLIKNQFYKTSNRVRNPINHDSGVVMVGQLIISNVGKFIKFGAQKMVEKRQTAR